MFEAWALHRRAQARATYLIVITMDLRVSRPLCVGVVICLGTIAVRGVARGAVPLAMRVDPYVAFAPADLRVQLEITPNASNRSIMVVAESEEFYRSSELPLEAEEAPHAITIEFRGVPRGQYSVSSETRNAEGRTLRRVEQDVSVLSVR
jgi:hypothetical protein